MRRFTALVLSGLLLLTSGCGLTSFVSNERVAITPQNPNCLWHLKQGRDYVAQERYELAKEQYLMAVAACDDGEGRDVATKELKAVDMMIQTQR